MSKKKEQLGKGLRALLTKIDEVEAKPTKKKKVVAELSRSVTEVNVDDIEPNPYQPRKDFIESELLELVQSIKTYGLIQPITLRKVSDGKFQIISGERRWRASKLAGKKKVPAYLRMADDQGMLEMALVENIQRSDLNALEVALSYQRLVDECNLQHDDLAKRVGKERSTVSNYIRLLKLPPNIQEGLKERKLSMGHARALISVKDPVIQVQLYKKIVDENLSVRQTEQLIKDKKSGKKTATNKVKKLHPEVRKIKDRLSHYFGAKVDIDRNTKGKGKMTKCLFILLALLTVTSLSSQTEVDTLVNIESDIKPSKSKERKGPFSMFAGNPGRAALYSLILPGAGQAYNKKYWKVPIALAAEGVAIYFLVDNSRRLGRWNKGVEDLCLNPGTVFLGRNKQEAIETRDKAREYRDYAIIGIVGVHLLQVADAFIHRHLIEFDVREDISLEITKNHQVPDIGFTYNF